MAWSVDSVGPDPAILEGRFQHFIYNNYSNSIMIKNDNGVEGQTRKHQNTVINLNHCYVIFIYI